MRPLGATVLLEGADLAGAQVAAEEAAADGGGLLAIPADTAELIAGVGTTYLEVLDAQPDLDALVVPVGSGTGAASACLVAARLAPRCRVIAVQSSPAAHDSWQAGKCVHRPDRTAAEGLATGRRFELPQRLLRAGLAEFHLVSDEQIHAAQQVLAGHAHTLAEAAGAPPRLPPCWPVPPGSPGGGSRSCAPVATPRLPRSPALAPAEPAPDRRDLRASVP